MKDDAEKADDGNLDRAFKQEIEDDPKINQINQEEYELSNRGDLKHNLEGVTSDNSGAHDFKETGLM